MIEFYCEGEKMIDVEKYFKPLKDSDGVWWSYIFQSDLTSELLDDIIALNNENEELKKVIEGRKENDNSNEE